ncbi:MAG: HAMP domain-containing histidine kinase [Clostridia bacterium]|nr:HAMP domain-containing histidine kinase [Clostridia bacterium]
MFKSIFTKFFATFVLIIVLSFSLMATLFSTMIAEHYRSLANRQLKDVAEAYGTLLETRISESGSDGLAGYFGEHRTEMRSVFAAFRKALSDDFAILLTDADGAVLFSFGFRPGELAGSEVSKSVLDRLSGGAYTGTGDLDGVINGSRSVYGLSVNVPGGSSGAVFVCKSSESVNQIVSTTVKTIIMTSLWMTLATLIAVYFISERIAAPLHELANAAKAYGNGKFDVRVKVSGTNEVAELGAAMNNMAASIEKLENTRSEFLSSVAHDLRTPMTTISGFVEAILDGTIPKDRQDYYLRLISEEIKRISKLVSALLDVSRLQSGDRKFVMAPFDVCEMARIILINFEQKIEKKKLDVEFDAPDDGLYVYADHDAVYQILYNICDNAVKFSREGGKYRVRITRVKEKVSVSVYNEGDGIPEEDLPKVFDRFYKADRSRGMDRSGTGLGLYIAKSIIDAHGEDIKVDSVYGKYCEFTFTLAAATDSQIKKRLSEKNARPGQKEQGQ